MILEELRTHTASAHRELEEKVRIEDATRDRESYRQLLERFFGFHRPMDDRIAAAFADVERDYDAGARRKSIWLMEDLGNLGVSKEQIAALEVCSTLPDTDSLARAYGCAYVLEGSTLGGRHISRMLDESPVAAGLPRRFFESYGSAVGERWKEFCASLDRFAGENPGASPEIVGAAQSTFTCFRDWVR
jgi:heme oxygenase